jgi:hypothetical protein
MAALPTVYQFPSFMETEALMKNTAQQCIWYLPNKKRRCQVTIAAEDERKAAQLARYIRESGPTVASAFVIFAKIAELTCCVRHHRNKIYGSGLAQELANQWLNETNPNPNPGVKTECDKIALPAVEFARHEVYQGESLRSLLCSDLRPNAPAAGSIYFYTHAGDAFSGMIKIGYTSQRIESRLDKWGECGYGLPELLGSCREVRHPERVEHLTHYELEECWHALRWCKPCGKAHQEWFKVKLERALAIASLWSRWMRDANPYDRRGHLKSRWKGHIEFLIEHGNPITANAMFQIHEIEIGLVGVDEFVDDTALRSTSGGRVKKEEDRDSC